jgi:hypothetical protein
MPPEADRPEALRRGPVKADDSLATLRRSAALADADPAVRQLVLELLGERPGAARRRPRRPRKARQS